MVHKLLPVSTLSESFIQSSVAKRLNTVYYRRKPAYISTEEYTQLKRADVLLAFMRARNRPYVAVVEAKSRTTIHQLKLKDNRDKARRAGRLITIGLIVGLSVLLGYQWYFNALNTLILFGIFLAGTSLITALLSQLQLRLLSSISAIEQLGRYPANESWIAVGEDTFVRPQEYRTLRQQCRKNGVGLIIVDRKGRLNFKTLPKPRHVFNDYLGRYGKRNPILAKIDRPTNYGPSPSERRQNRRRYLNIGLMIAITGLLMLLAYDMNYGPSLPDPFTDPRYVSPQELVIGEDQPEDLFGEEELVISSDNTPATDCPIIATNERGFVIVDAVLPEQQALRRLAALKAAGLRGHLVLSSACLLEPVEVDRLVVYTGALYPGQSEARQVARAYQKLLLELRVEPLLGEVRELKR